MKPITNSAIALAVMIAANASGADEESQGRSGLDDPVQRAGKPIVMPEALAGEAGPEIVIRPGEDAVFYEYRVNGQLREIKVVPTRGREYYLVPAEGGGWIREDETTLLVPSWVIFRW